MQSIWSAGLSHCTFMSHATLLTPKSFYAHHKEIISDYLSNLFIEQFSTSITQKTHAQYKAFCLHLQPFYTNHKEIISNYLNVI